MQSLPDLSPYLVVLEIVFLVVHRIETVVHLLRMPDFAVATAVVVEAAVAAVQPAFVVVAAFVLVVDQYSFVSAPLRDDPYWYTTLTTTLHSTH